jgi:transposase
MHRSELSEAQFARIEPLLPDRYHHGNAGHPFNDHRPLLNGIFWILRTGAPWRDLPERYGPWQTVFYRFNRWRADGTWSRIVTSLLDELDQRGKIDHHFWCVDGSNVRGSRAAAGARKNARPARRLGGRKEMQMQEPQDHALGRSRGGFGTKVHVVCDKRGIIVAIHVTAGQRHESKAFAATMARRLFHRRKGTRRWPRWLAGDKGYSYPGIRRWCRRRRIVPVIPTRSNQPKEPGFDKKAYRRRNNADFRSRLTCLCDTQHCK